jgi:uncharacterized protein
MNYVFFSSAVLAALMTGLFMGTIFTPQTTVTFGCNATQATVTKYSNCFDINYSSMSSASINVPAVDHEGNGVVTSLRVDVVPGTGRVLANIDKILFWADTQDSIRTARAVAENVANKDLLLYDIVYTIKANATLIEGPSAGAAITVATIAAVQGKRLKEGVMITGSINGDGSLGVVGGMLSKANASRDAGAELFIVPKGQAKYVTMESIEYCERVGWTQACITKHNPVTVDLQKESGIRVEEVNDVREAMKYFY